MQYPPLSYDGPSGEVSTVIRRAGDPPDLSYPGGTHVHYLATGGQTDGLFGLYRWAMGPEPSGPGPHFHRSITESFFILSGTVSVFDGEEWVEARSGDFAHVPAGGIHGFRNLSGEPAEMLLHFAPGAPREAYFEGLLEMADMSDEDRYEFFHRHDNIWVG